MDRRLDPRSIVTPYAFSVHPDLLGMPLATPWQRLGAILLDLIVIGLVSRIGWETLGIFTTLLLLWMAVRKPARDALGKVFRVAVGCLSLAVLAATITVIVVVQLDESGSSADEAADEDTPAAEIGLTEGIAALGDLMALRGASDEDEALDAAGGVAEALRATGLSREEIRSSLLELVPEDAPWAAEAPRIVDDALASMTPDPSRPSVPQRGDSVPPTETDSGLTMDPRVADSLAALEARIQGLQEDIRDSRAELASTRQDLEEAEDRGIFDWLWNLIDDLGLGFGWAALYMTATHSSWRGSSVGKKVFGIRVVMIDKRPLTWWLSFERAGGYAAGFATGLLGFAQVFWDPNRQAIHDKVSETIVIQDGKEPVPGPWIEEGRERWNTAR
jgi:hypothetical protein